mgnify:CR=1 FL=1
MSQAFKLENHMTIENENDVIALKRIGKIVSSVLHEMLAAAEPGMKLRARSIQDSSW